MTQRGIGRRGLLGLAGLGIAEAVLSACSKGTPQWNPQAGASGAPSGGPGAPTPTPTPTTRNGFLLGSGKPVHVRLYQSDGATYGVGLPLIAYLNTKITDSKAFVGATKVTVNGQPAAGGWYFQASAIYPDYPVEAHYRLQDYWPAHANIKMEMPLDGLSAGAGLVFDDSLTLDVNTGAKNITMVDGHTERLITTTDDQPKFNFPVSLGKAKTPTFTGTKVVMERDAVKEMIGTTPGDLYDLKVPWSCRITNSGEFIHAASWNGGNIGQRSTSNGCTNLNVTDAQNFFNFAQVGDVAVYTNTGGPVMPSWDGYGCWNLPWSTWQTGGLIAVSS
jgi:lipoprotein-anchoring transpeptidase ErfK/SrfK